MAHELELPLPAGTIDRHQVHSMLAQILGPRVDGEHAGYIFAPREEHMILRAPSLPEEMAGLARAISEASMGGVYAFRLDAAPRRSGPNGRKIMIDDPSTGVGWLEDQGRRHGFWLHQVTAQPIKVPVRPTCGRPTYAIYGLSFNGVLQVTSASLFNDLLVKGIGHNRAHGFGLMEITPQSLPLPPTS